MSAVAAERGAGTGMGRGLSWAGVARLGLVQTALGAVVVLTTSTLNRVMVVELALPALLPGLLVALHHAVQITRPRMGHGSDAGGRRTPWIVGGMAVLALGGVLAAWATTLMAGQRMLGVALAVLAFALIGLGVSAGGTSLLALLAKQVAPPRRAAAATVVWLMMIMGFAITATVAGKLLDPYSPERLMMVSSAVSLMAVLVTVLAVRGVEREMDAAPAAAQPVAPVADFRTALREVWAEPVSRRFTAFVFLSMLAYSSQDLILEPFAGLVFGFTPGESTALAGVQNGGVLVGMLAVAILTSVGPALLRSLSLWSVGGCLLSAVALLLLALGGFFGAPWPLRAVVALMGVANGMFSIAAIATMMKLAGHGRERREGTRMGLWGAAQGIAFGFGGLAGAAASDAARWLITDTGVAYGSVFALEALLFVGAAVLAWGVARQMPPPAPAATGMDEQTASPPHELAALPSPLRRTS